MLRCILNVASSRSSVMFAWAGPAGLLLCFAVIVAHKRNCGLWHVVYGDGIVDVDCTEEEVQRLLSALGLLRGPNTPSKLHLRLVCSYETGFEDIPQAFLYY